MNLDQAGFMGIQPMNFFSSPGLKCCTCMHFSALLPPTRNLRIFEQGTLYYEFAYAHAAKN